jgi:nucleotide-binding universal stress UspA family protein
MSARRTRRRAARAFDEPAVESSAPRLTTRVFFTSEPNGVRSHVSSSTMTGAILLATDGREGCADAVIFAMAMARQNAIPLQILSVVEPLPLRLDEDLAAVPAADIPQHRRDAVHHRVRRQLHELFGRDDPVGINVEEGNAAETILRKAHEWSARLVVIGAGRPDPIGRSKTGPVARVVATQGTTPTVVIARKRWRIPRTIVIGTDFSDESVASACEAVALAAASAVVHVVHVRPVLDFPQMDPSAWSSVYARGAATLFDSLGDSLRAVRSDLKIRNSIVSGRPAEGLRDSAQAVGADMIAVGRHSLSRFDRFWLGSVTEALLEDPPCSVLVTPSRPSADRAGGAESARAHQIMPAAR